MKVWLSLTILAGFLVGCSLLDRGRIQTANLVKTAAQSKPLPNASATSAQASVAIPKAVVAYSEAANSQYEFLPIDSATGQPLPGYPPIFLKGKQYGLQYQYSGDGRQLAVVESRGEICEPFMGGTSCWPSADLIHLINLETWQVISATLSGSGWAGPLAFSPDDKHLAIAYNTRSSNEILLVDAVDGRIETQAQLDFQPEKMAFIKSSHSLAVYGQPQGDDPGISRPRPPRLVSLAADSLKVVWEQELQSLTSGFWCQESCDKGIEKQLYANYVPGVAFAAAQAKLFILHADGDQMEIVDLTSGKVEGVRISQGESWLEKLLSLPAGVAQAKGASHGATKQVSLSPDGSKLYVLMSTLAAEPNQDGIWEPKQPQTQVQVIDIRSRQIIAHTPTQAPTLRLDPSGKYILLDSWVSPGYSTWILSADDLAHMESPQGWQAMPFVGMDGKLVWLAVRNSDTTTDLALFDPHSLQISRSWSVNGQAQWVVPGGEYP